MSSKTDSSGGQATCVMLLALRSPRHLFGNVLSSATVRNIESDDEYASKLLLITVIIHKREVVARRN